MNQTPRTTRPRSLGCAWTAAVLLTLSALPILPSPARAQNPSIPPFYQVYGGLFYPSESGFREAFDAPSDFVWGMGMGLPVSGDFLFIIAEYSWFRAQAYVPGPPEVNRELAHNFIHVGLLNKVYFSPTLALRFQGGVNYNSIERKEIPVGGTETKSGLGRKIGYFGGVGIENAISGGRMSVFADAVYDYRRSTDRAMFGDFGGVRIVAGVSVFWF